jgi:hypothetical protein
MEWKDVDWQVLRTLRDRFLNPAPGDYWRGTSDLAHYDLTFARRIASKWDAIWEENLPVLPASFSVWDWGCGTGVATETLALASPGRLKRAWVSDHSPLARRYSVEKLVAHGVPTEEITEGRPSEPYWLLVSHVWNELSAQGRKAFWHAINGAEGFVWVEPGTPPLGAAIVDSRELLRKTFSLLAPCPHQQRCGLLETLGDWCHHFAPPDPSVFTTAHWTRFTQELGIDLRSLPVSYLVGRRDFPVAEVLGGRVIGRPRVSKAGGRALVCRAGGVKEEKLPNPPGAKAKDFREVRFVRRGTQ